MTEFWYSQVRKCLSDADGTETPDVPPLPLPAPLFPGPLAAGGDALQAQVRASMVTP